MNGILVRLKKSLDILQYFYHLISTYVHSQAVRRSNASRQSLGSASGSAGSKSSLGSQLNKVQKTKTQRYSSCASQMFFYIIYMSV